MLGSPLYLRADSIMADMRWAEDGAALGGGTLLSSREAAAKRAMMEPKSSPKSLLLGAAAGVYVEPCPGWGPTSAIRRLSKWSLNMALCSWRSSLLWAWEGGPGF